MTATLGELDNGLSKEEEKEGKDMRMMIETRKGFIPGQWTDM